MHVGVLKETFPGERRVALVPAHIASLTKAALRVTVEHHAGLAAGHPDEKYAQQGARLTTRSDVLAADVVLVVRTLGANPTAGLVDVPLFRTGQVLIDQWVQNATSFTPASNLPTGNYRFWVQTWADGVYGNWSNAMSFVIV